jgi:beta-lactamase regulating signal transducer with metallopeptidase domain
MYCNDHMLQANALYAQYKAANAVALATFSDDALDQAIALRQEYARRFLDYEDTGAHSAYIGILQRVRSIAAASSSVAAASSSVAAASSSVAAASSSVAAASSSVAAASSSVAAAYRRTAYNRWMMDSAYFSDFKRVVGLRSVAVGNL